MHLRGYGCTPPQLTLRVSAAPALASLDPAAFAHLRAADPVLGAVIDRVSALPSRHEPDLWRALVGSIIGQQLSLAAAGAIRGRVAALDPATNFPGPARLLDAPDDELRQIGLSRAKVTSVKDLSAKWLDGTLDHAGIPRMGDEQVVSALTAVKGIGRWTAEMVLIFHLRRPDVLPAGDLGVRAAVQKVYELPARPQPDEVISLAEPWKPFRSAATLLLWQSLKV